MSAEINLDLRTKGSDRKCYGLLAAAFGASHAVYYLLFEVPFDTTGLYWFLHFLDVELLRERLIESVWYLHIQPPGMNLFAGAVLKLFGENSGRAFHALFLLMALAFTFLVFASQRRLGVSRRTAFAATFLFSLSPPFIFYEHWLFYTFPCALLVVLSAYFVHRYAEAGSLLAAGGAFAALALLCVTRSLFHLSFFVLMWAFLMTVHRQKWKQAALLGLLPALVIFSLYGKNYLLFGEFTLNTMMGRNLWIGAVGNMSPETRANRVEQGLLSEVSLFERWNDVRIYPEHLRGKVTRPHVPALAAYEKTNGAHNFNHEGQIAISRLYLHDAMEGLRRFPRNFILSQALSWYSYTRAGPGFNSPAKDAFSMYNRVYEYLVFGKSSWLSSKFVLAQRTKHPVFLGTLIGIPVLFLFALVTCWKGFSSKESARHAEAIWMAYACLFIAAVAIVGNTFEVLETYRFRFMTDGLSAIILGVLADRHVFPWMGRAVESIRSRRISPLER